MFAGQLLLYGLGACGLLAAGVGLWLRQSRIMQREAFQALAARRGWSLTISEQKLGRPAILRLTARSGSGWHTETRLYPGSDHGMPDYLTTEFVAEDPVWPEGSCVLLPADPVQDQQSGQTGGPASGPLRLGRSRLALQDRVDLALTDDVSAQLLSHAAPPGLWLQATADPLHRFDLEALAKVLAAWTPLQATLDGQPMIRISPQGFKVQVNHAIRRADQMERFIDFALELIRVI